MKRTKKSQKKTKFLLILLVLTAILSITATYAWFSSQRDVDITGIKLNVEVAESMQISLDGATWYQSITIDNMRQFYGTYADSTKPHADKDSNTNYVPTELIPASTIGEVASGKLQLMTGDSTLTGSTTSAKLLACSEADLTAGKAVAGADSRETNNAKHPYLVFDMYLRNYSAKTSDELQLNKGSRVWVDTTTAASQEGTGKEGTGLENCARVGFVVYDNPADVTAAAADIRAITPTTPQVVIWEPNYNEHIAEVIASGRATASTANTTYGAKFKSTAVDSATAVTVADVYATDDTTNLGQQYAFRPAYNTDAPQDGDDPLLLETTAATTMTTSAQEPANVTLQPNKVTKVRVYIWLEGQDVDCINTASQGDRLQATIKLTKPVSNESSSNSYAGDGTGTTPATTEETTENT